MPHGAIISAKSLGTLLEADDQATNSSTPSLFYIVTWEYCEAKFLTGLFEEVED